MPGEYSFEPKFADKLIPIKLRVNYWLLRKLGLWGFSVFAFAWGVILTIIVYELVLLQ